MGVSDTSDLARDQHSLDTVLHGSPGQGQIAITGGHDSLTVDGDGNRSPGGMQVDGHEDQQSPAL